MIEVGRLAESAGVDLAEVNPPGGSLSPVSSRKRRGKIFWLIVIVALGFIGKFVWTVTHPDSMIGTPANASISPPASPVSPSAPLVSGAGDSKSGRKESSQPGVVGVVGERLQMSDGLSIRWADLDYQLRVQVPGRLGVEMDRTELPKLIPYRVSKPDGPRGGGGNGAAAGNGVKPTDGLGQVSQLSPPASNSLGGGSVQARSMAGGR